MLLGNDKSPRVQRSIFSVSCHMSMYHRVEILGILFLLAYFGACKESVFFSTPHHAAETPSIFGTPRKMPGAESRPRRSEEKTK